MRENAGFPNEPNAKSIRPCGLESCEYVTREAKPNKATESQPLLPCLCAYRLRPEAYGLQPTAYRLQPSSLRSAAYGLRPSSPCFRVSAFLRFSVFAFQSFCVSAVSIVYRNQRFFGLPDRGVCRVQ